MLARAAVIINHTVNTEMLELIPAGRMWFVLCISLFIISLIYNFRDWRLGFCGFKMTEFLQHITVNQMTNAYWYLYTYLGIMVMLQLLQRMSVNMKKEITFICCLLQRYFKE